MQTAVLVDDKAKKMAQLHPVRVHDFYRNHPPSERHEILEKSYKTLFTYFHSKNVMKRLFAEFFLEINNHLGENILENLMTVLLHRAIRKMRPSDKISPVFQYFNVANGLHDFPF
jgi:hypothetical protein